MIPIKELFLGVQRTFRVPRTTKVVVLTSVCRKDCSFLCSILAYQDMRAAWALASEKAFVSSYLSFLRSSHDSLLDESGVVSVTELNFAAILLSKDLLVLNNIICSGMSGPSSEKKTHFSFCQFNDTFP